MGTACNSSRTNRLLQRVAPGPDPQALEELFARHQERLRKMVRLRLDGRLRGRVSSSVVLQQVYLDACRRIGEYLANPALPFFLWLRSVTGERIQQFHRQHFGDQAQEAGQELCPYQGALPEVSAASMAAQLMGDRAAHRAAVRADVLLRLQSALNNLDPLDREIVALRHLEELSNDEAALVLGMDRAAAPVRYVQALKRFSEIVKSIPD
jgi:RNA polymerase sigma-70 factor (ECF subfamily)